MNSRFLDIRSYEAADVSAQSLADAAGTTRSKILAWERAGFIQRKPGGGYNSYPLIQLPKVRLLALLEREIGLDGDKASALAERLLTKVEEEPDAVEAVVALLRGLYENFDEVMDLMIGSEFQKHLLEMSPRGEDTKQDGAP